MALQAPPRECRWRDPGHLSRWAGLGCRLEGRSWAAPSRYRRPCIRLPAHLHPFAASSGPPSRPPSRPRRPERPNGQTGGRPEAPPRRSGLRGGSGGGSSSGTSLRSWRHPGECGARARQGAGCGRREGRCGATCRATAPAPARRPARPAGPGPRRPWVASARCGSRAMGMRPGAWCGRPGAEESRGTGRGPGSAPAAGPGATRVFSSCARWCRRRGDAARTP